MNNSLFLFKKKVRGLLSKVGGVNALAAKMGVTQPTVSKLLGEGSGFTAKTLDSVADALGVPAWTLIQPDDAQTPEDILASQIRDLSPDDQRLVRELIQRFHGP